MRRYILDTNAIRQRSDALDRLREKPVYVPLTVVQELLYQVSRERDERPARAALQHLMSRHLTLIPDHDELLRRAFGVPTPFWNTRERRWWSIIRMAASGSGWPALRAAWNVLAAAEPKHTTSAEAFIMWKEKGGPEFAREMMALADRERQLGDEAMRHVAAEQNLMLDDDDRRHIRRHLREQVTLQEYRRIWLFNQLAAAVGVVSLNRTNEAHEAGFFATYNAARTRYRGGLEFAMALYERAHDAWVLGKGVDRNDFFDIQVLVAIGDASSDIFVTQERTWHQAAMSAGLASRVARLQDV